MKHAGKQQVSGPVGRHVSARRLRLKAVRPLGVAVAVVLGLGLLTAVASVSQAADPCVSGNAIVCENSRPGNPSSDWETSGVGAGTIEGFTTDISVSAGSTVNFKIHAEADYTLEVFRMGYYGGAGARRITSLTPNQAVSQSNLPSACVNNSSSTGLIDCGPWGVSASWAVPSTAVSGIYFAYLNRTDGRGDAHVMFVVRNDDSHSDIVFQTSDTTWQAYNNWGGNSLYAGEPVGRAYKVSYNRPFNTRGTPGGRDFVWANEYPMVRFMEANGYDMTYQAGIDTDRAGSLLANHKTFLSIGHDEYWSGQQRTNVENARDAGMNLAFFSANEVYWKTRYEPSVDGSNTAYRTLVTYKETRDNARTDPTGIWTGTWRDPRFSPPADGGRPENSLTGTIFTVNSGTRAIQVPAADGKMRFWRGTAVGSQADGAVATLPMNTLGYEWDEDLDNGFRPKGAIRMSTSNYDIPEKLIDYGSAVAPGNATHSLVLYRAASGALVFGAGTVQWTWGLDSNHDGAATDTDDNMRQATVNLMADMSAQPTTLQSGLSAATKSADTTPATAVITSPAAGATIGNGTTLTVTGTATDTGGGRVGGVEVSVDGGQTWHPATGRESWSYTAPIRGVGQVEIQARASDDSANVQATPATRQVTVACPCSLFAGQTPGTTSSTDTSEIELGVKFTSSLNGWITGVRFYKGAGNTGTHTGTLWSSTGTKLADGTFVGETESGWQTLQFTDAVAATSGTTYVASYHAPVGRYAVDGAYFQAAAITQAPLTALRATDTVGNGVYSGGATRFPTTTYKGANYWVSPVFDTVKPPDVTPPTVVSTTPVAGATSVPLTVKPTVTFSEAIAAGSTTIALSSPAGLVAAATTFDATRKIATVTPSAALSAGTTYTLAVNAARDDAGNALTASSRTFRTAISSTPGVCPCSIWADGDEPATVTVNDKAEVELGVKFKADTDGFVSGIRFYKGPQNVGTHVGTLWSTGGTELATATFTGESATGWQEVRFSSRVSVTAGTTYVASYHTAGYYSATTAGLARAVVNPPLTATADAADTHNGVYRYGARSFPTTSGGGGNYWVDVVFELPPDVTAPGVASTSPAAGATNVRVGAAPAATFTEAVSATTGTLTAAGGTVVPVTLTTGGNGRVVTLTPASALAAGTSYTAQVSGARDAAGNVQVAPFSWSFTTAGATACPCTLYPSDYVPALPASTDTAATEVGVRFTASAGGFVSGVRFYKGTGNTGTHTGSLWNAAGSLLASATFTGESATGWQQVTFAAPVAVTADTAYVASYGAPVGRYAADANQFASAWTNGPLTAPASVAGAGNGVYATVLGRFPASTFKSTGYGVDPVFSGAAAADTVPPSLVSTSPVNGATSTPPNKAFVGTFDEPLAPASVVAQVTGPGGAVVPATTTVGSDRTVTVTPTSALAYDTSYSIRITGSDLAGNAMTAPAVWTVRTATAPTTACPCALWTDETAPAVQSDADTRSVEVGVKFSVSTPGYVTGIRFYKGARNTGTHTGSLWSADGTRLATVTFGGESAAGWQTAQLSTAVQVTTGVTYVASYLAPSGGFSVTSAGFAAGVTRGPLSAPLGTSGAPNGVYAYGTGGFPTTGVNTNYWISPVFDTAAPADLIPPTVTTVTPTSGSTAQSVTTAPTAVFSEAVNPGSVVATISAGGTTVPSTTTYDAVNRRITVTPTARLASSTVHTVTITAADVAGNVMAAPRTWTFTTADVVPPTVTAFTPADGALDVAPAAAVSATFSEPVTPSSVVFTVKDGATAVPGSVSLNATNDVVSFTATSGLPQTRTLTASVSAWDVAGNVMVAPVTWSFTTADTTAPSVSSVTPAAGATGVAPADAVTATFTEPVTTSSLVFTVKDGSASIPGSAIYDDASRTATFVPAVALPQSRTLTASVGAADATGNAMTPLTWSFTTADVTSPTVTTVSPAGDAVNVAPGSPITATFSEPVGASSVVLTVRDGSTAVPGTLTYDVPSRVATFVPSAPLPQSRLISVSVQATDLAGNPMDSPLSWSFTTVDNTPPSVVTVSPASGATGVADGADVTATFSEPITASSLVMTVKDGTTTLAGSAGYDDATRVARFVPDSPLPQSRALTVSVQATDVAGNAMTAPLTWTFTTADATAPTVTTVSPAADAVSVSPSGVLSATFSEPVISASVVFTVKDGSTTLPGTTAYDATSRVATFTPASALPQMRLISVSVQASDVAGNAMATPRAWSFTTADTTAPTVTTVSPAADAATVSPSTLLTATFSEPVTAGSVVFTVKDGTTTLPGTTAYDATSRVATFTPASALPQTRLISVSVVASDVAGNAMAAPRAWSFTTADTVAPVVTAVVATPSATGATVTWTTDESSSSVVQYGTSLTSLTSTATGAAGVTAHSTTLTGLTGGTRYYYRVTSVDPSNNSTTSPAVSGNAASFAAAANLAQGAPVSTSSTLETAPWGAAKAVDGVLTSTSTSYGWTSTSSLTTNHTEYFQVDLGSAKSVNQVTLWPRTDSGNLGYGYPVNFTVATSTDGTTFSTASTVTGAALPTGAQNVTFTAQTGRYVRITGTSLRTNPNDGNQYRMQFAEVGVYALTGATPGTAADVTAPVVSAVAVAGNGATGATVTWTTDEVSSSVVQYGTAATALTSTATGANGVTVHSVPLTGLAANTRYYYRVTSADPSANTTTSPATGAAAAQYAPAVTPIVQTSSADFTSGVLSSGYVSPRAGGDVVLAPAATQEFTGNSIPSGWSGTSQATGSSVTVANDLATVSGQLFRTTATYGNTREVDMVATLKPVNNQWLGATDATFTASTFGGYWAAFRTTTTGALVAETRNGIAGTTTTNLSNTLIGTSHRYEIDWTGSQTIFSVDGVVVATQARGISVSMVVGVKDGTVDANPITVDSVWVSPYAASGTYTSAVVDAGGAVDWGLLTATSTIPAGTAITYQVRTGPNATAGGTGWSAFTTVAAGADIPGVQRYLQYRATLTTNATRNTTPTLSSVTLGYAIP